MKVLNLNVWGQSFYWEKRLPLIISMLTEAKFSSQYDDVLFLNQLTNTKDHLQLAEINKHLGYSNSLFFETERDQEAGVIKGMGLLTNLEVVSKQVVRLSQNLSDTEDNSSRILVMAHLKSARGNFIFAGIHLAISFDAQVRQIRECVDNLKGFNINKFPVIICADLNCSPQEFPANILRSNGYTDIWQKMEKKEFPSWPVNKEIVVQNHRVKYNTDLPWEINPRRVDYIWSKKVKARSIDKISKQADSIWHSDHWGLVADF